MTSKVAEISGRNHACALRKPLSDSTELVYGILLTDEGWVQLGEAVDRFTQRGTIGRYIHCCNIDAEGRYFRAEGISVESDTITMRGEILIPHQYIKCVVGCLKEVRFSSVSDWHEP